MTSKEEKKERDHAAHITRRLQAIGTLGGACQRCGNDNPADLIFHYRKPVDVEIAPSIPWGLTWTRLLEALKEYDLYCSFCRTEVIAETKPHGTNQRYRVGCHCPACRDAHRAYNSKYSGKEKVGA